MECFFQYLMLNISSLKELLHKSSEIQWNITGTLPGKLKKKFGALSYKVLPHDITKMQEIAILEDTLGSRELRWNSLFFLWFFEFLKVSASIFWLKYGFNFKLGFLIYFKYISGSIIWKNIVRSDYHSARWYWCKKD